MSDPNSIPKDVNQDLNEAKKLKTRRGKRRTKAQNNALRREDEARLMDTALDGADLAGVKVKQHVLSLCIMLTYEDFVYIIRLSQRIHQHQRRIIRSSESHTYPLS